MSEAPTLEPVTIKAKAVGEMFGVSVRTIWRWSSAGRLPQPARIGTATLWRISDLKKWAEWGFPCRRDFDERMKHHEREGGNG